MKGSSLTTQCICLLKRIGSKAERGLIRWLIETRGVSAAVRYLRNPNPHLSIDLLRAFGAEVGAGTTIKRSLRLDNVFQDGNSTGDFRHIEIGSNCYIGDGVYFDLANRIVLRDGAILSGQVSVITHADCNRSPYLAERFPRRSAPVRIEEGTWIGFGTTLLAGTTIEKNSVVAAESLVSKDIDSHSVYAGTPACKVRSLSSEK
ncbi:acyltransferase [Salinibacter altiplanensis]|uniref:acyltransferase n=1 Tax=Salinibacter altiplanensis TaxID=1803181 RepID=UPI00131A5CFE|nr:acyltransferase [Salinibacter altiplanensis]